VAFAGRSAAPTLAQAAWQQALAAFLAHGIDVADLCEDDELIELEP